MRPLSEIQDYDLWAVEYGHVEVSEFEVRRMDRDDLIQWIISEAVELQELYEFEINDEIMFIFYLGGM